MSEGRPVPESGAIPQLTRLGLSVHADLVYRHLRLYGAQSVAALARAIDLTAAHTARALEELVENGAVRLAGAGPRHGVWNALPPDMVLDALRDRRERIAVARSALQRSLSMVDILGTASATIRDLTAFTNVEVARRRFDEVVASASAEYLAMNPEASFTRASAEAAVPVSRSALRNGARTLSLGVPNGEDDQSEPYSSELYAYGLEYRELARQPVKLAIVDRRIAFFPIDPSRNFYGGLWEISVPDVVDDLASFFLRHWEVALSPSPSWRPPDELTDRERAVLAALAQGDTDDMAARRLRLSSRTIRYVVSDLMERYQVKTRFQLGLVIGRRNDEGKDS